ncbi:MAG: HAMP domain-containing histidine kinase [Acidobacteria bacterium]|nr:HAMP domain-containing histidine kinase [Acidobacteriota bacterium]
MDTNTNATRRFVVPPAVLSTASHELRGPLGVARGHLRLLAQDEGVDPRIAKAVGDASRALDRMTGLLDELSRYAQWARGESGIAPARASLREVLTQAAARAVSAAGGGGLTAEIRSSADVVAEVDLQRLAEACASLVIAVARAHAGAPAVSLAVSGTSRGAILRIEPLPMVRGRLETRPPDLGRGGMGLAVPFADLVTRAHRGVLTEQWSADTWYGYRVRLPGPA